MRLGIEAAIPFWTEASWCSLAISNDHAGYIQWSNSVDMFLYLSLPLSPLFILPVQLMNIQAIDHIFVERCLLPPSYPPRTNYWIQFFAFLNHKDPTEVNPVKILIRPYLFRTKDQILKGTERSRSSFWKLTDEPCSQKYFLLTQIGSNLTKFSQEASAIK